MRKRLIAGAVLTATAAFGWTAHAVTQEAAEAGIATPQDVVVQDPRAQLLEEIALEHQAKVAELRERVIESQEEFQARVGAALGPRAPEATIAPMATIAPVATVPPAG
jgi:hypothetical protein